MENRSIEELKNQFEIFYQQNISPIAQKLEHKRKLYLTISLSLAIISLIFLLSLGIELFEINQNSLQELNLSEIQKKAFFIPFVVVTLFPIYFFSNKVSLLKDIMNYFNGFSYHTYSPLDINLIKASSLAAEVSSCKSGYGISGCYQGINFLTAKVNYRSNYSFVQTSAEAITNGNAGQFIVFQLNHKFAGKTVILNSNKIFSLFNKHKLQKLNLINNSFTQEFSAYSSNQGEALGILTPEFLEKLLKVKQKFLNIPVDFCFFDNKLIVDIHSNILPSDSIFKSYILPQYRENRLKQILSILEIINILELNKL